MRRRRWDIDERGIGVTDAGRFEPHLRALAAAMAEPGWIAEDPEAHLLAHLERAVEASAGRWRLLATRNDDGLLELELAWTGGTARSRASLRADAFGLIGAIAESASLVRQRVALDETVFEVTTGMLEGDGPFAPHGHLLRLRVRLPSATQEVAG
jgi:hypothetical protein